MGKRAVFLTPTNILDTSGNGGVKASQEHLKLLQGYFGNENVDICIWLKESEIKNPTNRIKMFKREESNIRLVFSALCGCKIYLPWHEREVIQYIDDCNPDILFIDFSILGRLIRIDRPYKTIVFFHNIEADYSWNKVKNEGFFYLPSYWASRFNDKWAAKADGVICLNKRDSKRLYECYGRKADLLIPITFHDIFDETRTTTDYEHEILFLGSLFAPNQLSIEWFIREVMPLLNNIKLNIVGKDFENRKYEYEHFANVKVIGTVSDTAPYYYRHPAVIMPIRYGAGMKVKTAEAMMFGRRIFASDEALEGYEAEGVPGITRCNTAAEFADAINNYFDENVLRSFEPEVRSLFVNKYSTECLFDKFNSYLNKLMNG